MNYDKIIQDIKEIVDIASSLPEIFQEKCFEVLLNNLLAEGMNPKQEAQNNSVLIPPQKPSSENKIPSPVALRAFMQRTSITDDELNSIMLHENGEIHFIHEPTTTNASQGQIEWSLLLALKKAVLHGEFNVDPEDVRSICKEKGYYKQDHFIGYFKKNSGLFKGQMVQQGSPQSLTPAGLNTLAKLIKTLASGAQS